MVDEANSIYFTGKEFLYDHVQRGEVVRIAKPMDTRVNVRVNPQRRSLKVFLLIFIEPYTAAARESEKYFNPDLTKISVTIDGRWTNSTALSTTSSTTSC